MAAGTDKESRWFVGKALAIIVAVIAVAMAVWMVVAFYLGD
jgi:hypothetical protein